jgi:hypothetical protein
LKKETSPNTTKNHSDKVPQYTVLYAASTAVTSDDELGESVHDPFRQALSYLTAVITCNYTDTTSVPLKTKSLLSVLMCLAIHSAFTQRKYAKSSQNEAFKTLLTNQ